MDKEERNKLAIAYIHYYKSRKQTIKDPNWWAVEKFMQVGTEELSVHDSLNAILIVLSKDPPDKVISNLAAPTP
ncbi:MAG: hypothetical protein GWO07_04525 [Candidatus Dadabacteria bacterium]|nr:hypothetical protein [Candidatus Dadabacteria bacterium]NIS08028.1 hypothetical protein [Candidatus Dadabacteria bacterium]NIV40851.1 hypothetical protein [Candidatus Dadabacteria bacterium]NIY21606.1 hypothetical protein [Candidatus Dadabacteria bacterium]